MSSKRWSLQRLGLFIVLGLVAAAAACSGGGSNPTANFPSTTSQIVGTGTYTVNSVNGINSTMVVAGTGTIKISGSASAPTVGAIPAAIHRATTGSSNQALIYYTVSATSATTITSLSISVGFPTQPTTSVYLAYWNGTEWVANSSAATPPPSGSAVTLNLPSSATPITLQSGQSLYVVVYTGQQVGTPPPPPPSISPAPQLTMSEGTVQTVTVYSKPGFTITASSSNVSLVSVSPSSAPVPAASSGPYGAAAFTLTAGNSVGTATITFTDSIGQKTSIAITTSDTYSASPSPSSVVLGQGGSATITIASKPGTTVQASSADASVATVNTSATATTSGAAFTVTAKAAGSTTITFTDTFGNTGTLPVVVSGIRNGAFTNGMTGWTNCSYAHTALTAPVNDSTPEPENPVATQSPGAATAAVAAANLTGLSAQVTPPPNDNPSPPAGVTSPAPAVLGGFVALVGTINSTTVASPKGEFGICQQITVPASPTLYLSFWEWEGNTEFTFKDADEDAVILDSTGTTVQQTLFVENHCYVHPAIGIAPGVATSSGCWPGPYGGDTSDFKDWIGGGFWTMRGPYNLSAYAGQTITLYMGNWSFFANGTTTPAGKFANFIFVGNVQLIPSSTFPTTTVTDVASRRNYTLTLHHR